LLKNQIVGFSRDNLLIHSSWGAMGILDMYLIPRNWLFIVEVNKIH